MLAAEIWHWWIGVVLVGVGILSVLGLVAQYLKNVTAKQYPNRRQRQRRLTGSGRLDAAALAPPAARSRPPGTPVVCAFSGGPDSTALLVLAVAAGCDVTAIHVDHGLRPTSADRGRRAPARLAAAVGVPCDVVRVDVADGPNLEARARDARRAALPAGALTGHTADDRAATLLVNLLRGAGADGLAAMGPPPTRPILDLRRAETRRPVRRPRPASRSTTRRNDDRRFVRNRVRDELLPLMADIAGRDVVPLLVRTADLLADDAALAAGQADGLDATDARALAPCAPPLARRVVRRWLTGIVDGGSGYPPDAATVDAGARGRPRRAPGVRDRRRRAGRTSPPAAAHRGRRRTSVARRYDVGDRWCGA